MRFIKGREDQGLRDIKKEEGTADGRERAVAAEFEIKSERKKNRKP